MEPTNTQATPATTADPQTQTPSAGNPGSTAQPAPSASGLSFIPEAYRNAGWATKYTSEEDLWKGVDNMAKLVGQKQVVQGLQLPGEEASPEEVNAFYTALGRPESADKYELPKDLAVPEGYNIDEVSQNFRNLAHKNGIPQKQAAALFKDFIELENQNFQKSQETVTKDFEAALKTAFPQDAKTGLDLAKKGAKLVGGGDILDQAGLSTNPIVLQLCAKLGELSGESNFVKPDGNTDTKASILEEAKRIQATPEYQRGDKALHEKVSGMYKQVYG